MKIDLSHPTEFKRLLEALVYELIEAREHFYLRQQLVAALDKNSDICNLSLSFWNLTLRAHTDAILMRLCKAYDLYKKQPCLNLRNFLETVQANPAIFDEPNFRDRLKDNPYVNSLAKDPQKPTAQLQQDLHLVRNSAAVKKLKLWRDNYVAHRSKRTALALSEFTEQNPLTFPEIDDLIDRGLHIVNHYSRLYQASHYIPWESDDYKHIFEAVRRELARREGEIQQQIEAIKALEGTQASG